MIAGLEQVSSGRIFIGTQDVTELPPAKRRIAMVFQNYALFPHLTVAQNLAVPLRMSRLNWLQRLPLALGGQPFTAYEVNSARA